jgi:hypothetical protein
MGILKGAHFFDYDTIDIGHLSGNDLISGYLTGQQHC